MARRIKEVPITAPGRDQGKSFIVTEKSAIEAERWGTRAMLLLVQSGANIPDVKGMAGVALAGLKALTTLRFDDVEPLLKEMLDCVTFRPDPKATDPAKAGYTRPLFPDDIEEVSTLMRLREEIIDIHLGFSIAEALSKLQQDSADKAPPT